MEGKTVMTIDYIGHSGFLVETDRALFLFDYFRGGLSLLDGRSGEKPLFVFVSHAHPDHFNPDIFSLSAIRSNVKYLLSFDLRNDPSIPADADAMYLDADADYTIPGLGRVRTLLSTDEGVAFLADTGKETIFHAGDLHWWDWPGEDPEWLSGQKRVFQSEVAMLAGTRPDIAFLVLDDRLEEHYAEGMAWFLSVCAPAYALPMHYSPDSGVVERFLAEWDPANCGTKILNTENQNHWEIQGGR